jgi:hypothetical protein
MIKEKNSGISLSFLCFFLLFLFYFNSCLIKQEKNQDFNRVKCEYGVHPAILFAVKNYNSRSNDQLRIDLKDIEKKDFLLHEMNSCEVDSINQRIMVVKFFGDKNKPCFTLWESMIFPEFIRSTEGIVKIDKSNSYFFSIGNINLIIIDKPERVGSRFYFNKAGNKLSKVRIQINEIPKLTDRDPVYDTYCVDNSCLIKMLKNTYMNIRVHP